MKTKLSIRFDLFQYNNHLRLELLDEMDLIQRLKTFLDSRGIGVTQFADECAIPRPTASQLLAGRNKKVSDEMIGKIHQVYPELSVMWLMFGEGDMIANSGVQGAVNMQPQRVSGGQTGGGAQATDYYTPTAAPTFNLESELVGRAGGVDVHNQGLETQTPPLSPGRPAVGGQQTFSFGGGQNGMQMPEMGSGKESNGVENANSVGGSAPSAREISGRRVVGVVVFYDDNSFQSFSPDAVSNLPFMQK